MISNILTINLLFFLFSDPKSLICTIDEINSPACENTDYEPVCGVLSGPVCNNSPTGHCLTTFHNKCWACYNAETVGWIQGPCEGYYIQPCTEEHITSYPNNCKYTPGSVCGITEANPQPNQEPDIAGTVFSSACDACTGLQTSFYFSGSSHGECQNIENSRVCKEADRGFVSCIDQGQPVCGYYNGDDCPVELCRRTYPSSCDACADAAVLFHREGSCDSLVPPPYDPALYPDEEEEELIIEVWGDPEEEDQLWGDPEEEVQLWGDPEEQDQEEAAEEAESQEVNPQEEDSEQEDAQEEPEEEGSDSQEEATGLESPTAKFSPYLSGIGLSISIFLAFFF